MKSIVDLWTQNIAREGQSSCEKYGAQTKQFSLLTGRPTCDGTPTCGTSCTSASCVYIAPGCCCRSSLFGGGHVVFVCLALLFFFEIVPSFSVLVVHRLSGRWPFSFFAHITFTHDGRRRFTFIQPNDGVGLLSADEAAGPSTLLIDRASVAGIMRCVE